MALGLQDVGEADLPCLTEQGCFMIEKDRLQPDCHGSSPHNHRSSDVLAERARRTLEESELFRGRSSNIRISESDGLLVLEGHLPTYYLKQMLQTLLRDVEGVQNIDNKVWVDSPKSNGK